MTVPVKPSPSSAPAGPPASSARRRYGVLVICSMSLFMTCLDSSALNVTSFLALSGFLFVNTLYLQDVRGFSALGAGASLLPATAAIAACSLVAGPLVGRFGPRVPLTLGGVSIMVGGAPLLVYQDEPHVVAGMS